MKLQRIALITIVGGVILASAVAGFFAAPRNKHVADISSPTPPPVPSATLSAKRLSPKTLTANVANRIGDKDLSPILSPIGLVTKSPTPLVTPWPDSATPQPSLIQTPLVTRTPAVTTSGPSPTPWATTTQTPTPLPTVIPTPTPTPTISASPTPTATLQPTATSSPVPATVYGVIINEVAWMGTENSSTDEWIELYNSTNSAIDLSGWKILIAGDNPIQLSGTISAGGFYLLERTDDTVISDISADYTGSFGRYGLNDAGEHIALQDASGASIDDVECSAGWFAGTTGKGNKASMERVATSGTGSASANWATNNGLVLVGSDAIGQPVHGTPGYRNSVAQ